MSYMWFTTSTVYSLQKPEIVYESESSICCYFVSLLFFFSSRRRHTRLQGDWSSDVCSSDLRDVVGAHQVRVDLHLQGLDPVAPDRDVGHAGDRHEAELDRPVGDHRQVHHVVEIGRASCRERV